MSKKAGSTINNEISMYFHCAECIKELPKTESPMSYQRIQAGWTKRGLQIWCVRHDRNIYHLDFLGQKVAVI